MSCQTPEEKIALSFSPQVPIRSFFLSSRLIFCFSFAGAVDETQTFYKLSRSSTPELYAQPLTHPLFRGPVLSLLGQGDREHEPQVLMLGEVPKLPRCLLPQELHPVTPKCLGFCHAYAVNVGGL